MYTPWFSSIKHDPVRAGTYEVCESPGTDIARCRWTGKNWLASPSMAGRMEPLYWRGLDKPAVRRVRKQAIPGAGGAALPPQAATTGQHTAPPVGQFLSTPCMCGGENESCFRCGGWGYIDSIGKGRAAPEDFVAGGTIAPSKPRTGKVSRPKQSKPLKTCPHCGAQVLRLQKHLLKSHRDRRPIHANPAPQRSQRPASLPKPQTPSWQEATAGTFENAGQERQLDATRDYYAAYRDNGQFGSHASHDGYDEESKS